MLLRTVVLHRVIISFIEHSPIPSVRKSCMPGHRADKSNLEQGSPKAVMNENSEHETFSWMYDPLEMSA